jgi:hypothetical protein
MFRADESPLNDSKLSDSRLSDSQAQDSQARDSGSVECAVNAHIKERDFFVVGYDVDLSGEFSRRWYL